MGTTFRFAGSNNRDGRRDANNEARAAAPGFAIDGTHDIRVRHCVTPGKPESLELSLCEVRRDGSVTARYCNYVPVTHLRQLVQLLTDIEVQLNEER